jgi:hypothetical protein
MSRKIGSKYYAACKRGQEIVMYRFVMYRLLIALVLLGGCASKTVEQVAKTSFTLGQEDVAVVGTPFISQESGSTERSEHWEGILFGGMHRAFMRGDDYRRAELFYAGRSGNVLTFMFQLTDGNDGTPSIRRLHQVDFGQENRFAIEGLEIQVLQADTNSMRYRVLGAASMDQENGTTIQGG